MSRTTTLKKPFYIFQTTFGGTRTICWLYGISKGLFYEANSCNCIFYHCCCFQFIWLESAPASSNETRSVRAKIFVLNISKGLFLLCPWGDWCVGICGLGFISFLYFFFPFSCHRSKTVVFFASEPKRRKKNVTWLWPHLSNEWQVTSGSQSLSGHVPLKCPPVMNFFFLWDREDITVGRSDGGNNVLRAEKGVGKGFPAENLGWTPLQQRRLSEEQKHSYVNSG